VLQLLLLLTLLQSIVAAAVAASAASSSRISVALSVVFVEPLKDVGVQPMDIDCQQRLVVVYSSFHRASKQAAVTKKTSHTEHVCTAVVIAEAVVECSCSSCSS
jgi:hypothetical protein